MANANKCPMWVFAFVLCFLLSLAGSSTSFQSGGKVHGRSLKGLFRNKRQACADGTYHYNERTCCLCGAGLKLKEHCTAQQTLGDCEPCETNTYSSHPNSKQSCEPCRSCDHPNANLEVDEPCTPARNTKCRCKKDHYCTNELSDPSESCRLCNPCKLCGAEGIKVACTTTNNTVCQEGKNMKVTVIVIVIGGFLLVIVAVVAVVVIIKCRKRPPHPIQSDEQERLPLKDLKPYLSEIVEVIGLKDMKNIAMCSDIPRSTIEFCERNHPQDAQEQALQLLDTWIESQGRKASESLILMLRRIHKNRKAEDVIAILSRDNAA